MKKMFMRTGVFAVALIPLVVMFGNGSEWWNWLIAGSILGAVYTIAATLEKTA